MRLILRSDSYLMAILCVRQGAVQRLDNYNQWVNPYPADKVSYLFSTFSLCAGWGFIHCIKLSKVETTGPRLLISAPSLGFEVNSVLHILS